MANCVSAHGSTWIAIGIAIGAALGVGYHSIWAGMGIGAVFGIALALVAQRGEAPHH